MAHTPDNLDTLTAPETHLVSFVLRFVCDGPVGAGHAPATGWHGVLRHVQSDAELHFTRWEEVVAFISGHIVLTPPAAPDRTMAPS